LEDFDVGVVAGEAEGVDCGGGGGGGAWWWRKREVDLLWDFVRRRNGVKITTENAFEGMIESIDEGS